LSHSGFLHLYGGREHRYGHRQTLQGAGASCFRTHEPALAGMKSLAVPIALAALGCASATAQAQRPTLLAQTPEVCTEVYQPVCGRDEKGTRRTYSNACYARRAKAKDVTPGECPK